MYVGHFLWPRLEEVSSTTIYTFLDEIVRMIDSKYIILYGDHSSRIPLYTYIRLIGFCITRLENPLSGWNRTSKPKQDLFCSSAKVLWESRGSSAEEFCYLDGRSGLPTLCISTMILVALQNNSLIDVLCTRKNFLLVKLIFSVFISP